MPTISIDESTKKRLLTKKAKKTIEKGKTVTYADLINYWLDKDEESIKKDKN